MTRLSNIDVRRFCLAVVVAAATASGALAADGTWASASSGNWSTSGKWAGGVIASGAGSTANFNTVDLTADTTVHLDGDRTLTNLVFGDTGTSTAGGWILDNNGTVTNNLILAGTVPTVTVNALGAGKAATVSAVVEGSAGLVKAGNGTLTLAAANTFSGNVTVAGGSLVLQSASALAVASALSLSGGSTLGFHSDGSKTFAIPAVALSPGAVTTLEVGPASAGTANTLALGGALSFTANGSSTSTVNVTGSNNYVLSVPAVNLSNTGASGFTQTRLVLNPTTARATIGDVNGFTAGGGRDVTLVLDGTSTGNQLTGKISNAAGGAAWTFLTKQGNGTWTISTNATSNYSGSVVISAGILNIQVNNALGGTSRGTSVSDGATLQIQGGINYTTAEAVTLRGSGVGGVGALQNVSGNNTFAGLVALAGDARINSDAGALVLGNNGTLAGASFNLTVGGSGNVTIAGVIGTGAGGLTKDGAGRLTLSGASTYTGPTTISDGTLTLSGSLSADTDVRIAAGATLDVSALPAYSSGANATLTASGTGVTPGTTAAEIKGNATVSLGPLALNYTPATFTGDATHPALTISSGSLVLGGPVTVTNNGASPLGAGTYVLATQASGVASGTPAFSGSVGGKGIQPGNFAYLQLTGSRLEMVVRAPYSTTTTLSRHAGTASATTYGAALTFDIRVSPSTATGTVELRDGGAAGTLIGSAPLAGGNCTITPAATALGAGTHANIVARYLGTSSHLASTSAALAPAQSVAPKLLNITWTATNKLYDGTNTAALEGTLGGVEAGDVLTLNPAGTFASSSVGTGIAVTSTSTLGGAAASNYSFTQPAGLTANIIFSNIWTGGPGGTGTDLATGTNYSPAASTSAAFNAVFNGSDPAATDLTLTSGMGGAVGTDGSLIGVAGNQINPLTITGAVGASFRTAGLSVSAGAGDVTLRGTISMIVGGASAPTSHEFTNNSSSLLLFDSGVNFNSGNNLLRTLKFGGSGNITVNGNLAPATAARMAITKSGSGTLLLAGANTFSGGTTITGGEVIASTASSLGAGAVTNNATLHLTAKAVTYSGLSTALSGNGTINVTLGTGTGSTVLNGNYSAFAGIWNIGIGAAAGAGKVQMNGPDSPLATINVLGNATLYVSAGTHNASLVLNGGGTGESLGQLRLEGASVWAGNVTLAGDMTGTGDGTVGSASSGGTISGTIGESGGSRSLSKVGSGTITLTGNNTYTGNTTVSAGTLLVNSPGSLAAAGDVLISGSGTLGGNGTIHGPVTVSSGGTLEGPLTIRGPVTVENGGTLDASDPSLASPDITGSLTLNGTLQLSINRAGVPSASQFVIPGTLNRGGTLRVINTGPELQAGDSFTVTISAGTQTGSFASTLLPALGYGLAWDTSQFASAGTITVVTNSGFTVSTTTLTPATTNQQIHGVGANFCLGPQNIAWNTSQFNQAFSPAGLNISFARLANSFECALDEPDIFWSGWDSDNVQFIQKFRAIQPDGLITMAAWSPPGRLKSTGSAQGGTLAKNGTAYRYADYADWWLRSLQYLRDNSTLPVEKAIPDFISIQNESDFTPSGTFYAAWQAGNYLSGNETSTKAGYPQALAAVRSSFQANGFGFVKFIGPDTTTASPTVISGYLNNIPAGSLAAIAHHPYQGSTNNVGNNTTSLSGLRAAYPTSTIYMTEFFGDDSYGAGIPGWMQHCLPIHNVFTIEKANTYLMWGLSLTPTSDTYCALGHYSKFIRPNDWRSAATTTDANVLVSLYRHPVASGVPDQLVLVMTNKSASYSYQTVQTSAHWAADPARRSWKVYKTANDGSTQQRLTLTENLSGAALTGNRNLVLAPYSITTVVINSDAALSNQESWRQLYFGSPSNLGTAADTFDANGDGETNLMEFATGQDPKAATTRPGTIALNGATLEFSYVRSLAAQTDGLQYAVEWSDSLAPGSWSSAGVSESVIADNGVLQTVRAIVPSGTSGKRFVRLRVTQP